MAQERHPRSMASVNASAHRGPGTRMVVATTASAMVAFAANSVLCRFALRGGAIDAATFSAVRLVSGAAMLLLIVLLTRPVRDLGGSWVSAVWLLLYAMPFSFAYVTLSTSTGALVLFGGVQVTMIAAAILSGERPHLVQWCGFVTAIGGLVYLMLPGVEAPSLLGGTLMTMAGASWGIYSIRGRGVGNPLGQTAGNFLRAAPMAVAVLLLMRGSAHASGSGVVLAVASGALASAGGYVLWYHALRALTATRAAIVQLSVPILTAAAGVALLGEVLSVRLILATVVVFTGLLMALLSRMPVATPSRS